MRQRISQIRNLSLDEDAVGSVVNGGLEVAVGEADVLDCLERGGASVRPVEDGKVGTEGDPVETQIEYLYLLRCTLFKNIL